MAVFPSGFVEVLGTIPVLLVNKRGCSTAG
jgi:hypothetical protein